MYDNLILSENEYGTTDGYITYLAIQTCLGITVVRKRREGKWLKAGAHLFLEVDYLEEYYNGLKHIIEFYEEDLENSNFIISYDRVRNSTEIHCNRLKTIGTEISLKCLAKLEMVLSTDFRADRHGYYSDPEIINYYKGPVHQICVTGQVLEMNDVVLHGME